MIAEIKRRLNRTSQDLQGRTLIAALWSLVGSGGTGLIRFVSNLLLTRLLFPEAFGLMATAMLLMTLVQIFSDTGIKTALIQHPNGDTPAYINTSYIIALGRSLILFLMIVISIPAIANFYDEPQLRALLWTMSLAMLAEGFINPALPLLIKSLRIEKQVTYSVGTQLAGFLTTLLLVYVLRSVYALALGYVLTSFYRVLGSYLVIRYRPRLAWDKTAGSALLHFGKYIILNTMIGWAVLNIDRLVVGKVLGMEQLGYYNIALYLGVFVSEVLVQVFAQSYFPAVSLIANQLSKVQRVFQKTTLTLLSLVVPFVMLLVLFSDEIISLLYDPRYYMAGTVLFWISLRSLFQIIVNIQSGTLLAIGRPVFVTLANTGGLLFLAIALPVMTTKFGLMGSGAAVVLSSMLIGAIQSFFMINRLKFNSSIVLTPWLHLAVLALSVGLFHEFLRPLFWNYPGINLPFMLSMAAAALSVSGITTLWLSKNVGFLNLQTEQG